MNRRSFIKALSGGACVAMVSAAQRPLNVVMIYADDLGYGDLGVYGSGIPTPNLDRMAKEGTRFTQFYSANPVCSPSRAALLTGRYPTRVGVPRVLFPNDKGGLSHSDPTIAEMLKPRGYNTMCIGKWHLGRPAEFLPTSRGFDEYFGIPYSNDMTPRPLMHNTEVIEEPAKLETLTPRYTEQALRFIERSREKPFFLYMPHTYPHIPLAASPRFRGKSPLGLYGDVVEELDWSVGEVFTALRRHGLDDNTLVMFSSDNGPWYQGSPGRLRGRKGMTLEGGVREPFIARLPGRIPAGKGLPRRGVHNGYSAHHRGTYRHKATGKFPRRNRYLADADGPAGRTGPRGAPVFRRLEPAVRAARQMETPRGALQFRCLQPGASGRARQPSVESAGVVRPRTRSRGIVRPCRRSPRRGCGDPGEN